MLDVGSATGFFAFEFERRGAEVVSVELDSLYALDRFPGQPKMDIALVLEQLKDAKELVQSTMEQLKVRS